MHVAWNRRTTVFSHSFGESGAGLASVLRLVRPKRSSMALPPFDEGRALAAEYQKKVAAFLRSRTVAILRQTAEGEVRIGTGTLVTIRNRLFISTAGHNLAEDERRFYNVGDEPGAQSFQELSILRPAASTPDVGCIEIEANALPASGGSLSLGQLDLRPALAEVDGAVVAGFPGKLVGLDPRGQAINRLTLLTVGARVPLPNKTVTATAQELGLTPLGYKEEVFDVSSLPATAPDPSGISGGGVWTPGAHVPEEWDPATHARLVGIEVSWLKEERVLFFEPIRRWLELVDQGAPDLHLSELVDWSAADEPLPKSGRLQPR
jgi:hypothetical protein